MSGAATRFGLKAVLMALFTMPALVFAVTVGPLDGKPAPALPAVTIPGGMVTEDLPDTSFPQSLEAMGDLPSAALEWQRIAHKANGTLREQALANAARLHMAMGHTTLAATLVKTLLEENPTSPHAQPALYALATGPQSPTQATSLQQLQQLFPGTPYTNAALLTDVWHQAETTEKVTQTYNLPQAEELKKRLTLLSIDKKQKIATAGALGVLAPGLGHIYAGNTPQGITVFLVFCLFMLAFLSSCRHKHYAYSFLFIIPAFALWATSPAVAMQMARETAHKQFLKTLPSWADLRPEDPTKPAAEGSPQSLTPNP